MAVVRIGVGLPVTSGAGGPALVAWARRAEELGFASLATIDRIVHPGSDPLVALAAAAAVTSRIGLMTNVLLAPTRPPVLLARQAATVDQLSGGRLVLGLGVGRRRDDYEAAGLAFGDRGRRLDATVEELRAAWATGRVTPPTARPGGVPLVFGGRLEVALPRVVAAGVGWTVAFRPAAEMAAPVDRLRSAWRAAGREGTPSVTVMHYFALGEGSSVDHVLRYYAYQGDRARGIADGATRTAAQAAATVLAYAEAGVDEYVFAPADPDPVQLDRLADAVLA